MRKNWILRGIALIIIGMFLTACTSNEGKESTESEGQYPPGKFKMSGYGAPQYLAQYYTSWLERNADLAPGVEVEVIQTENEADARTKAAQFFTSGAYDEMPDIIQTSPVSMVDMAEAGMLMDLTDYLEPLEDKFVDGAFDQLKHNGKIYGLPDSIRPQLIYYNVDIFEEYGIDPEEMKTVEGYLEVGRKLKEASNGDVYLSYIDPGDKTWRYYGRRGFLPQANAKIWDDEGDVVIDTDPGAKLAFSTIETLVEEDLVLKVNVFDPPLFDALREEKIATFAIGAFWDEFLRSNVPDMEGKWNVMPAPVYEEVGTQGAHVMIMHSIINKPNAKYADLFKEMWYDFHFNAEEREKWVDSMVEQNAPFANAITKELLEDDFWKEPSDFYGGQSFREMEGIALQNGSENLRVTPHSAEEDKIISVEIEEFIAGAQTMEEAIENMAKNLKSKIGKTVPAN